MAATTARQPGGGSRIATRILVPLALIACAAAVVALVADTLSASDEPAQRQQGQRQAGSAGDGGGDRGKPAKGGGKPKEYVVEPGDTLSGIAEKTGVPIDRIIRRNPDLDPRVLNAGQVIKLR